jgi:hypothetical protein
MQWSNAIAFRVRMFYCYSLSILTYTMNDSPQLEENLFQIGFPILVTVKVGLTVTVNHLQLAVCRVCPLTASAAFIAGIFTVRLDHGQENK